MTPTFDQQLREIIPRLSRANADYVELAFGQPSKQVLGPPAQPMDLVQLERLVELTLPPSYRAFLLLHNGWTHFSGDAAFLSTKDRAALPVQARLRELTAHLNEYGPSALAAGVPIVAGLDTSYFLVLDRTASCGADELEVVEYSYEEGVLDRYPHLVAFFEDRLQVMQRLVSIERGQSPPLT